MFSDSFDNVVQVAQKKIQFLRNNPIGYFVASMLAGFFVGFGALLSFTVGGLLQGAPYTKILMGLAFGIALSLVVFAGAELFTGNNMVMAAGLMERRVSAADAVWLWVICYLGNWAGSALLAIIFYGAGLASGSVGEFIAVSAAVKMSIPFPALLLRGVLCNMLVCLAVWSAARSKSESGKLTMIFWCLFAFVTTGFEHSIANMTLLTVSLLAPFGEAIGPAGYFYNILTATLGNMIGGAVLVAMPYFVISRNGEK